MGQTFVLIAHVVGICVFFFTVSLLLLRRAKSFRQYKWTLFTLIYLASTMPWWMAYIVRFFKVLYA